MTTIISLPVNPRVINGE